MALTDLTNWIDEHTGPNYIWYAKRLSGNDTLANGTHQAGPYIPKEFLFNIFPSLNRPNDKNPDKWFDLHIDSHPDVRNVRAVWYNNKQRGGTRNETRLTGFGGRTSALLDPENTGSLAVFAFLREVGSDASICHVWVCEHETEDDLVEDRIGPVEPSKDRIWSVTDLEMFPRLPKQRQSCWLEANEIPPSWLVKFPSGAEIVRKTVEMRSGQGIPIDQRLMKRSACEYEIFLSLEEAIELPFIQQGFQTLKEFIIRAQSIVQRRKARAGRSLELHIREIFLEEGLIEGTDFQYQPQSEEGKRPDFIFPSQAAYQNNDFPPSKLRMLAVKATCKDRWRQILNEAERIPQKHLLTLQEGISENQFREMTEARVQLVVPTPLKDSYAKSIQPHLQTLESFIGDVRLLTL
ncbi:MAG: type II restriction endonuclease [Chloroflexi bacterium]|nr:type II restriction endonuclease [Chloroflexota bacterium]